VFLLIYLFAAARFCGCMKGIDNLQWVQALEVMFGKKLGVGLQTGSVGGVVVTQCLVGINGVGEGSFDTGNKWLKTMKSQIMQGHIAVL